MKSVIFVLVVMFNSSAVCDEVAPKKTEKFVQETDTIYRMPEAFDRRDYSNGLSSYDLPEKEPAQKKQTQKKPAQKKQTKNKGVKK